MDYNFRTMLSDIAKRHKHHNWGLWVSFFVPIVVLYFVFAIKMVYPFGDHAFLPSDMYHQYAPFFSEFQHRIQNGESLFYSWNLGLGINFTALFAYYLASPFNWLIALWPSGLVIEFMSVLVIFKLGLCGLTMAYYLQKHTGTRDLGVCFFAIFYALSGYTTAYSWNIMWLDCLILFPLIMLGLERLISDGRGLLYCVTLGLCIFSNYYISMMICMFLVVYFFAHFELVGFQSVRNLVVRGLQFAGYSLIAGGLGAVVLIPEIYALQMTASNKFDFPTDFTEYFSILEMLARHIGNVENELGLDHWPNIFCGVAVLMFFVLYALSTRIKRREKTVYGMLLLFMLATFSMNIPNFIWHGFRYPNSLPARQSFIYIFLLLVVCYQVYRTLATIPWRDIAISFWVAVAFVICANHFVTADDFHFMVFYGAIIILTLYVGVLALYRQGAHRWKAAFLCAIALISIEAGLNAAITGYFVYGRSHYVRYDADTDLLLGDLAEENDFFRVRNTDQRVKGEGGWSHYHSASLFSSMVNKDVVDLYQSFGCQNSVNTYGITGSTPLFDMLLSVRYTLSPDEMYEGTLRTFVEAGEKLSLYENQNTLPVAFWVEDDFDGGWNLASNPVTTQNNLAKYLGQENVLITADGDKELGKSLTFTPTEAGEFYAYITNKNVKSLDVSALGEEAKKNYTNVNQGYLIPLGYCEVGDSLTLSSTDDGESVTGTIYRLSEESLTGVYQALATHPLNLTKWEETSIAGDITCDEDGYLYTSIPYDKGWKVTVDGVELETDKMLDTFLTVPLSAGAHHITLDYSPEGLVEGAVLSVLSLLILGSVTFWLKRREKQGSVEIIE